MEKLIDQPLPTLPKLLLNLNQIVSINLRRLMATKQQQPDFTVSISFSLSLVALERYDINGIKPGRTVIFT